MAQLPLSTPKATRSAFTADATFNGKEPPEAIESAESANAAEEKPEDPKRNYPRKSKEKNTQRGRRTNSQSNPSQSAAKSRSWSPA